MTSDRTDSFRFSYSPSDVRYGTGATAELGDELGAHGAERALVVTGRTVGTSDAVMDPVRSGLGDRVADVFAETTPDKRLDTAIEAARAMEDADADGIVAVGGGSSLDVATVTRVVAASDRDESALREEMLERGTIAIPDAELPPLAVLPTTLAGAELSQVAGITIDPEDGREPFSGGVSDPRLMPSAVVADPGLYATTPASVLTGSAMNGFDKGIETIYAAGATPFTDGTAVRGLQMLQEGLPAMAEDTADLDAMGTVVRGTLLVQYGTSRPEGSTLSIVHAFGHALRDAAGLQQGVAHAIIAPHAVAYLLEEVDGRRRLLAEGLGVDPAGKSEDDVATAIVDAIAAVRDALGLPAALGDATDLDRAHLPEVAELVLEDALWANAPAGLEPTAEEIVAVLDGAWDR